MKNKTLLRFRIYDGDREYTDYCIIDTKQLSTLNHKQIISKFFYDNDVGGEMLNISCYLSDGRAVRIESEILITDKQAETLERLSIAFLHDFSLSQI